MKTQPSLSLLSLPLLTIGLTAASVDDTQIIDFQAGDPACAADVNQNIQALIDAINDNAAQIKELSDNVAKLPSIFIKPQPTLTENITGSVYQIYALENGLGTSSSYTESGSETGIVGSTTELLRQTLYTEDSRLTLNADNTFSFLSNGTELVIETTTHADHDEHSPDYAQVNSVEFEEIDNYVDTNFLRTGTWSLSGSELSLHFPEIPGDEDEYEEAETVTFFVSPDGNLLTNGDHETEDLGDISVLLASFAFASRIDLAEPDVNLQYDGSTDRVDADNNGTPYWLFPGPHSDKNLYLQNNGDDDLEVAAVVLIQDLDAGFTIEEIATPFTLAPNTEEDITLSSEIPPLNSPVTSSVYIFTNDPDTPTFIFNVRSESSSAPEPAP